MIRLHVLAVPHTASTKEYTVCAFTQKVINFCKMFKEQGMHVIHYGHDRSEVICDEHVNVTNDEVLRQAYGDYDWKATGLKYNTTDSAYQTFNDNCIREIAKRKQPGDIILPFFGLAQKPVTDAHPDLFCVEPSIGYASSYAPYKVYESYAVMHGLQGPHHISSADYRFYDVAIPSGFDLNEFEFREKKEDYFLMMGRLMWCKGTDIAAQVCERIGAKLIFAGTTYGPEDCRVGSSWPKHVEYVGYADVEKRKKLMAGAKGLFCPTIYNEPFGYVAIEAMLSGTPVITVDHGAFTETVQHGVTGYRCRTFEQFVWAAKNIDTISPRACREWAEKNYSFQKVGQMYKEYFQSVVNLSKPGGWYADNDERRELEWLRKEHPTNPKSFREIMNQYNTIKNHKLNFIQVGAMDGVKHDDLYSYVTTNNWSGMLIEPLPDMFEKLVENYDNPQGLLRFECCAVGQEDGETDIYRVDPKAIEQGLVEQWADGCTTFVPEKHLPQLNAHRIPVRIKTKTMKTLVEGWGKTPDFIQIDTEGYDFEIFMQCFNMGLMPDIYKIEIAHITHNTAVYMQHLLKQIGYKTFIDGYDLVAYRF